MDVKSIFYDYEQAVCKMILYCIFELPFPLGIKKTISVLKGIKSSFNIDNNLYNLATFSVLQGFTSEQLEAIIDNLISAELIDVKNVSDYKNMPVLNLNKNSIDFLENRYKVNIKFLESFMDYDVFEFDEKDQLLFDKLKHLRKEIAKEKDMPSFRICSDITLREITRQKPINKDSLIAVRGIGEYFHQNYGDKFISIIAEHLNRE